MWWTFTWAKAWCRFSSWSSVAVFCRHEPSGSRNCWTSRRASSSGLDSPVLRGGQGDSPVASWCRICRRTHPAGGWLSECAGDGLLHRPERGDKHQRWRWPAKTPSRAMTRPFGIRGRERTNAPRRPWPSPGLPDTPPKSNAMNYPISRAPTSVAPMVVMMDGKAAPVGIPAFQKSKTVEGANDFASMHEV